MKKKAQHHRIVWLNLYADGIPTTCHETQCEANHCAQDYRVACVEAHVFAKEGQGIDSVLS